MAEHELQYTTGTSHISVKPVTEIYIDGKLYDPTVPEPEPPPPEPEGVLNFDSFDESMWAHSAREIAQRPDLHVFVEKGGKKFHQIKLIPEWPCKASQGFRNEWAQTSKNLKMGATAVWRSSIVVPSRFPWGTGNNSAFIFAQCHANTGVGPPWYFLLRDDEHPRAIDIRMRVGTKTNNRQERYIIQNAWKFWVDGQRKVNHTKGCGVAGFNDMRCKGGIYNNQGDDRQMRDFRENCKEWTIYIGQTTVHDITNV